MMRLSGLRPFGLLLVVLMIFRPGGLVSFEGRRKTRIRQNEPQRPAE